MGDGDGWGGKAEKAENKRKNSGEKKCTYIVQRAGAEIPVFVPDRLAAHTSRQMTETLQGVEGKGRRTVRAVIEFVIAVYQLVVP